MNKIIALISIVIISILAYFFIIPGKKVRRPEQGTLIPKPRIIPADKFDPILSMIQSVQKDLDRYKQNCGAYPTSEQGLAVMIRGYKGKCCEYWFMPLRPSPLYMKVEYSATADNYKITYLGKDGGTGLNQDYVFSKTVKAEQ